MTTSTKAFASLDGRLIITDRVNADRPYFSGGHRVHGMNVQAITGSDDPILSVGFNHRIRGGLLGLGHRIGEGTIRRILPRPTLTRHRAEPGGPGGGS